MLVISNRKILKRLLAFFSNFKQNNAHYLIIRFQRIKNQQKKKKKRRRGGVELVIWNSEVEQQVNLVKLMIVANWYVGILCCVGVYKSCLQQCSVLVFFRWSAYQDGDNVAPRPSKLLLQVLPLLWGFFGASAIRRGPPRATYIPSLR